MQAVLQLRQPRAELPHQLLLHVRVSRCAEISPTARNEIRRKDGREDGCQQRNRNASTESPPLNDLDEVDDERDDRRVEEKRGEDPGANAEAAPPQHLERTDVSLRAHSPS